MTDNKYVISKLENATGSGSGIPTDYSKKYVPIEDVPHFPDNTGVPIEDVPHFPDSREVPIEDVPAESHNYVPIKDLDKSSTKQNTEYIKNLEDYEKEHSSENSVEFIKNLEDTDKKNLKKVLLSLLKV